jgi:hypothetical protein
LFTTKTAREIAQVNKFYDPKTKFRALKPRMNTNEHKSDAMRVPKTTALIDFVATGKTFPNP